MTPISQSRRLFPRSKRRGFSRLATFVAIPSSAVLTIAFLAVTFPWTFGSGGPQPVVAQEPEATKWPNPFSPRNPPRRTSGGDASDRRGRPGPSFEQRRATDGRRVILRPVKETDPVTGNSYMRYVQEVLEDDPLVPGGTRPVAIPEGERAAIDLAQQLRRTENEREREELHDRLRAALSEAFEQRRERQLREIEELERQLDSLRRLDAERQERKDDIVRRRMKQLLGEPDVLDWDPPSRNDLAFPFEAPRGPETSRGRSFDAPGPGQPPPQGFPPVRPDRPSPRGETGRPAPDPMNDPFGPRPRSSPKPEDARTTDWRPSPDRRPSIEDETQPERPRSRGTLRAENIEIELPDGPQGEAPRTTDFRAASAERILDLTETIARLKADTHRHAASIRKFEGNEKAERWMQSRRAEMEGDEARLRLARLEWETVGRELGENLKLAQQNHQHIAQQSKRYQELFALGKLPSTELANQDAALTRAKAEMESAERRALAWMEMDEILRKRAASLMDDHDEAKDASAREAGSTENAPRRDEANDRDDERTPEARNPEAREASEQRLEQPDEDRKTEQQPERETETGDGTETEDADGDRNADEATDDAAETPGDNERETTGKSGDKDDEARDESTDTDP